MCTAVHGAAVFWPPFFYKKKEKEICFAIGQFFRWRENMHLNVSIALNEFLRHLDMLTTTCCWRIVQYSKSAFGSLLILSAV